MSHSSIELTQNRIHPFFLANRMATTAQSARGISSMPSSPTTTAELSLLEAAFTEVLESQVEAPSPDQPAPAVATPALPTYSYDTGDPLKDPALVYCRNSAEVDDLVAGMKG